MRFGIRLPTSGPFASPEAVQVVALLAEQLGYDAVLAYDHVHWGEEEKYHFFAGSMEAADRAERPYDFYEPLLVAAHLAGLTSRITFITAAVVLAWRHPVLLARQVASLHALLGSRFVLGAAVGNVPADFEAMGVPWEGRGKRGIEHLRALRTALGMDGPSTKFEGKYVRFPEVEIQPRPEGLRIWYCASSELGMLRSARLAHGWMPGGPPRLFRERVPRLHAELQALGRGGESFDVACVTTLSIADDDETARATARRLIEHRSQQAWFKEHGMRDAYENALVGDPDQVAGKVAEYAEAGVGFLGMGVVAHSLEDLQAEMRLFARRVMPAFQAPRRSS